MKRLVQSLIIILSFLGCKSTEKQATDQFTDRPQQAQPAEQPQQQVENKELIRLRRKNKRLTQQLESLRKSIEVAQGIDGVRIQQAYGCPPDSPHAELFRAIIEFETSPGALLNCWANQPTAPEERIHLSPEQESQFSYRLAIGKFLQVPAKAEIHILAIDQTGKPKHLLFRLDGNILTQVVPLPG